MNEKELVERQEANSRALLEQAQDTLRTLQNIVAETTLTKEFVRAIYFLEATLGAIVTTGVGKSAFVAQRLAASLRLIGWRAWFMHPTEAMHGDIGGVMEGDILIAVSRSGDTDEVVQLLQWAHTHEMVNILISGNAEGYGHDSATVSLLHPNSEIDPSGTIPSASIVAAEMVADTLVATLYARRGDQGLRKDAHPGGTLGRRATLMAKDVMVGWPKIGEDYDVSAVPLVTDQASMQTCLKVLGECRGLVLVSPGVGLAHGWYRTAAAFQTQVFRPSGILTAGDIARYAGRGDFDLLGAQDVMTPWAECTFVYEDLSVVEAIKSLQTNGVMACPVVVPGTVRDVVGILHLHDCLRAGVL